MIVLHYLQIQNVLYIDIQMQMIIYNTNVNTINVYCIS